MSVYLHDEHETQIMVASNTGWSQLADYLESVSGEYLELEQLVEHGESVDLEKLADECDSIDDAEADVATILETIRDFCKENEPSEIVLVTNGVALDGKKDE